MLAKPPPRIHLPKGWQGCVKSAGLHTIALAHYAIVYARAWAADRINARVRLTAENDRLHEACALLREEFSIKDTRIAQIAPQRRPHYAPHERMANLELRAARGWSLKQTADIFLVKQATIASWVIRIDDQDAKAVLQLREPVNKFPDFVCHIVQRLKTPSPGMGKVKIAETLCRAGLHLGVTTVGRILKEEPLGRLYSSLFGPSQCSRRLPGSAFHQATWPGSVPQPLFIPLDMKSVMKSKHYLSSLQVICA